MIKYLDDNRPVFTCVYFRAGWNPICNKIEKDYDEFTSRNATWTHLKVDTEISPKTKLYFDARYEPQFLFLLNGLQIKR